MDPREISAAEAKDALGEGLAEEGLLESTLAGAESDSLDLLTARAQAHAPRRRFLAAAVGLVLLVSSCVGLTVTRLSAPMQRASVEDSTELGAMGSVFEALAGMAEGLHQAVRLGDDVAESYDSVKGMAETFNISAKNMGGIGEKMLKELQRGPKWRKTLRDKFAKFAAMNSTEQELVKQRLLRRYNITSLAQLKPRAGSNGLCELDEEELSGLCYKKCSLLTGGDFSFRISPFQCCQHAAPCSEHFTLDFRLCEGLDVSGDKIAGNCPHTPGVCLKNEELFGNFCYKRCSLLTYGVLPSRTGPQTCCEKNKSTDFFAVLDAVGCDTLPEYFQGGGADDPGKATPSLPHIPMGSLTRS